MKKQTVLIWVSLIILLINPGSSTAESYGPELPFILGTEARVSGMGGAGASLRGNASIQYYNPAAMSYLVRRQFTFFKTTLFDSESSYHTLSYAHPFVKYGTIGLSILNLSVGGIEERDNTNQLLSTGLHNSQTRVQIGFARHVTSMVSVGANLKLDHQSFAGFSATGIGLDIGLTASQSMTGRFHVKEFRQGLIVRNLFQPTLKLDRESVSDPRSIVLGLSVLSEFGELIMATSSIDLERARLSPTRFRFGQEVSYMTLYSLRFGIDDKVITYGIGVKWREMALDFAYRSQDIGNIHRISLSVRL